jgi:probable rRNA maturation factor
MREIAIAVLEAERVKHAMVSIALVTPQRIARLNRAHIGHAGSTDVISFALRPAPGGGRQAVVGDIYIAPAVARANAKRFGRGVREELARLVIHGVLHVLGHDHPEGAERTRSRMWRRQERLLAATERTTEPRRARSRGAA